LAGVGEPCWPAVTRKADSERQRQSASFGVGMG
jgi:hypothetical protein